MKTKNRLINIDVSLDAKTATKILRGLKTKKAKKFKKWLPQGEVIIAWASQSQPLAKSTNVFFEGKRLYSYGTHYLLGLLVNYRGKSVALINRKYYSKTTSGHSNDAFCSAFGSRRHVVIETDGDFSFAGIRKSLEKTQADLFNRFARNYQNGTSDWESKYIRQDVAEFNSNCKKLGFKKLMIRLPKSFFIETRELAKMQSRAYDDWNSRSQSLLDLVVENSEKWRESIFPRMTPHQRRNWDKTA